MPPSDSDPSPHREEDTGERKNPLPRGNEPFACQFCGARVGPLQNGSVRNHCPECLWSLHIDQVPGDRAERCNGPMKPVGIEGSSARGWDIIFRCLRCGSVRKNRAAHDDPVQPDRWELLVELSARMPVGSGEFPRRKKS